MANRNEITNETRDLTPQCKVVLYLWKNQSFYENNRLDRPADAEAFDISSRIMSVSFQKNMSEASGTFTITVANNADFSFQDDDKQGAFGNISKKARRNSGDWKDIVKRGTWCTIYMAQDGGLSLKDRVEAPDVRPDAEGRYLRCIGFIERISVKSELNEKGAFDVVYELSGRDFGVVYEDTVIWHNLFQFDRSLLDKARAEIPVNTSNKISEAIEVVHDLFYNPLGLGFRNGRDATSLTSITRQWLLPNQLLRDLGIRSLSSDGTFWGSIPDIKNPEGSFYGIQPTTMGFMQTEITDFLSGSAWDKLNQIAVRQFHELFLETTDEGKPKFNFRPIPWAIDKKDYPLAGSNIQLYKDVPTINVPAEDFVNFEVGEDNHNRYNSFLVTTQSTIFQQQDNISTIGGLFPLNQSPSIQRYGFRPMHVTVPALTSNELLKNGVANTKLLIEYNWVLYDYWNLSVFSETGEAELIGRNDVKLGKCLEPGANVPYISGRRYYIEGYVDNFMVDENGATMWTQNVTLTRGFEVSDLNGSGSGFRDRDTKFLKQGEYTGRKP